MFKNVSFVFAVLFSMAPVCAKGETVGNLVLCCMSDSMVSGVSDFPVVSACDSSGVLCVINDSSYVFIPADSDLSVLMSDSNVVSSSWPNRKSPFLAGLLSALIPGAGQLYATDGRKGWISVAWCYIVTPALWVKGPLRNYLFPIVQYIPKPLVFLSYGVASVYAIVSAIDLAKQANDKNADKCSACSRKQ